MAAKRRSSGGFTLIELLVVIAIISLLVGILVPCLQEVGGKWQRVGRGIAGVWFLRLTAGLPGNRGVGLSFPSR